MREVRRIKARVDDERLPRGADKATHLKLGRGGLADVEWTIQLLQMQHAGDVDGPADHPHPGRAPGRGAGADLLSAEDADVLTTAWRAASGLRNADHPGPRPARRLAAARRPGEGGGRAHPRLRAGGVRRLVNDYLRTTRLARQVVERVFWG